MAPSHAIRLYFAQIRKFFKLKIRKPGGIDHLSIPFYIPGPIGFTNIYTLSSS